MKFKTEPIYLYRAKDLGVGDLFIKNSEPETLLMATNREQSRYPGATDSIASVVIAKNSIASINRSVGEVVMVPNDTPVTPMELKGEAIEVRPRTQT